MSPAGSSSVKLRKSPSTSDSWSSTPARAARARHNCSIAGDWSTPVMTVPRAAAATAMRPSPTPSSTTGPLAAV